MVQFMSDDIPFDRDFDPPIDIVVEVAPGIRRITAGNPSPFTFRGTNTYIVGSGDVAIIDPGPVDEAHRAAIEAAVDGETVSAIVVTHTHRDHSPLARPMASSLGATVYGFGPHRPARPLLGHETARLDAGGDTDFVPDVTLGDGASAEGEGWRLTAVHTPGHTSNHIALELGGSGILFAGDHVMGWSTTIVAPPDGSMADYMASLDRLIARDNRLYLPGHGGPISEPRRYVRALATHRRQREAAILKRLQAGDRTIPEMVTRIYKGLDPRLTRAAGLSVLAHLEDMAARGIVACDGEPAPDAVFRPA